MISDQSSDLFLKSFGNIDKIGFLFDLIREEEIFMAFAPGAFTIGLATEPTQGYQGAFDHVP